MGVQDTLQNHWHAYYGQNGTTRATSYELRHTYASIVQRRIPEYLLKPVMGPSKAIKTHGVCAHDFDGFKDETADNLAPCFPACLPADAPGD